jgi:RNA polymerase sigma-70 factor (sigma-E family)
MPRTSRDTEFSTFVEGHRSELLRAARLLTAGDGHLAEDLVQNALVRLYGAWPRLRERPIGYAHRVIINGHIDMTRRPWWRRESSVSELPDLPDRHSPFSSGSTGSDDLREVVWAALAALPPRMRAVIVLRYWLDLSVEESADLLGCSQGTVKSQTARAVAKMRNLLGREPLADSSFESATPVLRTTIIPTGSF